MSNSPLVRFTLISPNSNNPRKAGIDKITIHHMAGRATAETCGHVFKWPERKASSNYGIGFDGKIGMYVEEKNRAWTSSNAGNDNRAVTIEVANDQMGGDWRISDTVMKSLIELCVDICKRNKIEKLTYTGDARGNLTRHNFFAATLCPGPFLQGKFPYIAEQVNKQLGGPPAFQPYAVKVTTDSLNIRKGPGTNYGITGSIKDKGIYTIVEEASGQGATKWGKLKSGAGWISLDYVQKK